MKEVFDKYKEKVLNELQPTNELNSVKSKMTFVSEVKKAKVNVIKKHKWLVLTLSCVLTCLIAVISTVAIIAYKNTPVYEGMEIVNNATKLSKMHKHTDYIEDEMEAEEGIDIATTENIEYYAEKGSRIIIAIHISNPKKYEILSLTINDYKYQSYEFLEEFSTSDVLYVRTDVGDVSGVKEYYINEIKYIDGTDIKNARFEGNRSIKVGVTYENIPSITVASKLITENSYNIVFESVDEDKLLQKAGLFYKAYLFSEEGVVYTQTLKPGYAAVKIENLKMNTLYQFMVCASLDILDGVGEHAIYMYSEEFTTEKGLDNEVISTNQSSINAAFDQKNGVTITNSKLYIGEELYKEIESDKVHFDGVYSDTEYRLEVTYKYMVNGKEYSDTLEYDCKTTAYEIPVLDFTLDKTKDTITVNPKITDKFALGSIESIKLFLNGVDTEKVCVENVFSELLSNNKYTVEIIYKYNLNDRTEDKYLELTKEIITDSYIKPEISGLPMYVSAFSQIVLDFVTTDVENICTITKIEAFDGETSIYEFNVAEVVKEDLSIGGVAKVNGPFTDLKVAITFTYDLHDGKGLQTEVKIINVDIL